VLNRLLLGVILMLSSSGVVSGVASGVADASECSERTSAVGKAFSEIGTAGVEIAGVRIAGELDTNSGSSRRAKTANGDCKTSTSLTGNGLATWVVSAADVVVLKAANLPEDGSETQGASSVRGIFRTPTAE